MSLVAKIVLLMGVYLGMGGWLWRAYLRGQAGKGELWSAAGLLIFGLLLGLATFLGARPPTVWKIIEGVFEPLGPMFDTSGG